MSIPGPEIMVSICCITYNHEKYITKALEGFLMQQTDFNCEILIGDDASTDSTNEIIEAYCNRYPDKIRLITQETNIGAIGNQQAVIHHAKGKYIALCDGDDFWTDPLKLQKQVGFLMRNPAYVICTHYARVIDDQDNTVYVKEELTALEFDYADLLLGKREETRISTLVARNNEQVKNIGKQDWYASTYGTDTFFKLLALAGTTKKIYVMPEVMACYRLHIGGIWSMIDSKLRKKRMISDFNLVVKEFHYSRAIRHKLLGIYISQFLLFDLRYRQFRSAVSTLFNLL